MSTETLTSLAMLKVHVDRGQDYLDYLRPFILQVLVAHTPDQVTDAIVRDLIRADFGLEIPDRAVQVVLKRLSRQYPLKKVDGVYRITGKLPDPLLIETWGNTLDRRALRKAPKTAVKEIFNWTSYLDPGPR